MTTRDDLVSRLSVDFRMMRTYDDPNGPFVRYADHASALEAKDAEIARLTACLSNAEDQFQAKVGEVIAQMDRISDLERQLAEETERCARAVYGAVGMIPMGQVDASEFLDKIEDAIAAAIRGSRS